MKRAIDGAPILLLLGVICHLSAGRSVAASAPASTAANAPGAAIPPVASAPAAATESTVAPAATTQPVHESAAAQTEPFSLWACGYYCGYSYRLACLPLALLWLFVVACITERARASLADRQDSRKLERALQACFAAKDLDRAAYYCGVYNRAVIAPVIAAMVAQTKLTHPTALITLERPKHAWSSAAAIELSKWTGAVRRLQFTRWVSLMLLGLFILWSLWRSLDDIAIAGATSPLAMLGQLRQDSMMISHGLLMFVVSLISERTILSRTNKLELQINQLSIDFIASCLRGKAKRQPVLGYWPGMWIDATRVAGCPRPGRGVCYHDCRPGVVSAVKS
jgi:hypothetical protein